MRDKESTPTPTPGPSPIGGADKGRVTGGRFDAADVLIGLGLAMLTLGLGLWSIPLALSVTGGVILALGLAAAWIRGNGA